MKDVLHILELLKRQAEAALALRTKRKEDALAHIEQIKLNIIEMGRQQAGRTDGHIYEQWCNHQRQASAQIQEALPILDEDIRTFFTKLETVQAKVTAAEALAAKQHREAVLKAEGVEEDAMLELSLLQRTAQL